MSGTKITWRDALEMPEDGKRYEAIGGTLYVTPSPSFRHQRIVHKLSLALHHVLEAPGHGWLIPDLSVEFPETEEGVRPDLIFVSNDRKDRLGPDSMSGASDLIIEILSPSTAERDRGLKRKLYERNGALEYWIVDPDLESVEVWRFAQGATEPERYTSGLPVRVGGRVVGEIELAKIFG